MSSAAPLVSVIVPAFNAGATVADALASALAQTYSNIEIIVADDGSTDGTAAIVERFAGLDERVTLIRLAANGGIAAARNTAIAAAKGDYIAPLDADDLWHPTKIAKQVATAEGAAEPPGFVYCWLRIIDGEGRVRGSGTRYEIGGHIVHRHLYKNVVGAGGAMLIRRGALEEAGGYDERLGRCEDLLLQLRIASRHPIAFVPEYLVGYRRLAATMSTDRDGMLRDWRLLRTLLRETCPGIRHDCDRGMDARQYFHAGVASLLERRIPAGIARLAQAGWKDPLWTFGSLRLLLARRCARRRTPAAPAPSFADADTVTPLSEDSLEDSRAADWLRRLNARRVAKLARLDADREIRAS